MFALLGLRYIVLSLVCDDELITITFPLNMPFLYCTDFGIFIFIYFKDCTSFHSNLFG